VVGVGMGVGPLFAGAVVVFNWRYLYLINALIALVSFILLKVLLPKEKTSKGQKVINIKGALLLMLSIASLVVLIMQAHEWSVGMDSLSLLFFILCLSCFLWVEKKSKSPIFFKSLFKHRRFMLAASINFCMNYLTWAVFFLLPLYFQLVGKYNVLQTGFMMLAVTMPLTLLSPLVSKWYMAGNPKKLIVFGFSAIALFLLFQFYHANQYVLLSVVGLIYGAGWALILNPVATIALSSIERESNGVAAGTFITLQEIGGTFGLAVSVSVLSLGNSFIHGYDGCIRSLLVVVLLAVAFTLMLPRQVSSSK